MSTDYNAIDYGAGADGYGAGAFGAGQGWQGTLSGGDPTSGTMGGVRGPVMRPPIMQSGGGTMSGVPGQHPRMGFGPAPGSMQQQSFKPFLSQMLGLSPAPQTHMRPNRPGGPRVAPPPPPITGFGPRPITGFGPNPGGIRMSPGGPGPQPVASGGTMAGGGQGRRPITTPGPRRVQPGQQQGY